MWKQALNQYLVMNESICEQCTMIFNYSFLFLGKPHKDILLYLIALQDINSEHLYDRFSPPTCSQTFYLWQNNSL